jgi:hypothetical protein
MAHVIIWQGIEIIIIFNNNYLDYNITYIQKWPTWSHELSINPNNRLKINSKNNLLALVGMFMVFISVGWWRPVSKSSAKQMA